MRKLRYLSAQPATDYYVWQVEVMINNFVEMGINPNDIDIVCWKVNGVIPHNWSRLAESYPARFFFYDDTRETRHYISSIRPNLLKQHFRANPYLYNDAILYHDSDIIFTRNPSEWITPEMVTDDEWYGSDTRWYIAHSYIKGKGDDVLNKMLDIMGMDEKTIEENELNSIGAQYLMKGVDESFWDRVERDSERLYKEVTELNNEKVILDRHTQSPDAPTRNTYHPIQIWCADMWAVLWGAWRRGYKTNCHKNFDFSWGTSSEEQYHSMNIMHNAGVVDSTSGLFYKAQYQKELPYGKAEEPTKGTASWNYWNWIQKTAEKSCIN